MPQNQRRRIYWLPLSLFVTLFTLFIAAGGYLHVEQQSVRSQKAASIAAQTKAYMETFSEERKQALTNLMYSWPSFEPNIEDWFNAQAQRLTSMQKGYSALVHANEEGLISWVYTPNNQAAFSRLSNALQGSPMADVGIEIDATLAAFSHRIYRDQSSDNSVNYLLLGRAISPSEISHGYLIASLNLDNILNALLGDLIAPDGRNENQFDLSLYDGSELLLKSGNINRSDPTIAREPVDFVYRKWDLIVQTRPQNEYIGLIVSLVGGAMSLLISLFLYRQLRGAVILQESQQRFRTASDSALDALLIYSPSAQDFLLTEANKFSYQLFDQAFFTRDLPKLSEQLAVIEQSFLLDKVTQVARTGQPFEEYVEVTTSVIHAQWVKVQAVKAGEDIALTFRDVSERFNAQLALENSEEKYRRLIDGLHQHFVYSKSINHDFDYVSAAVVDIVHLTPDAFCEQETRLRDTLSAHASINRRAVSKGNVSKPYTIEYSVNAEHYIIEFVDSPVFNADGEVIAIEGIARDVTEERALRQKVEFQASHDQLTGLYNRYAFNRKLKLLINEVSETEHSAIMCFIDMDRFKLVNDTCGHPAGDQLLKEVAQLFSQFVGNDDTLARVGGDEFCMLFRNATVESIRPLLDDLLQAIDGYRFAYDDKVFFIGASIGVIAIDGRQMDAAELIKAADNACYQAKYEGRNRYYLCDTSDDFIEVKQTESDALGWLQRAITQTGFELYCQKIHPLNRQTSTYQYEILVRMLNPEGQLVSPGVFIPLAERHGLMNKLDWWVIDNTLTTLEAADSHVAKLDKVAINLSGLTLGDTGMLERIITRVESSSLPSSKLCFEITETTAVTNLAAAKTFIEHLRGMGCRFALDDFGVGMSSFTYLKHLPVDYVKIDGSFVRNMAKDNIDFATVKAINNIAHSMGKETVAEFVVDSQTADALKTLRVDYGQGFALGKPVPLRDVMLDEDHLNSV